jgi:vitamin B12 transporter
LGQELLSFAAALSPTSHFIWAFVVIRLPAAWGELILESFMFKVFPRPYFVAHSYSIPKASTLVGLLLAVSVSALAADSADDIDEVVVQAFRLPATQSETGASVWVVDEAMIKSRGYMHMTDVLTSVPGLTINQNGPFGGQASARIRGASSDQTLVLVDGIVVNDVSTPGGGFNYGSFDVSDVARVEVLKGPQSTLWGSDAIGGVINIVSKTPDKGLNGDVGVVAGSFGTQQYRVAIEGGNDTADFRLSYNDISTDGISKADADDGNSEEDAFDSETLAFKAGVNLPGDARLQFSYRSTEADTEFDSFGVNTGTQDGDELSQTEQTSAQVSLTFPLFDDRLENTLKYADSDVDRQNFTNGLAGFSAEGERKVFQYQGTYTVNENHQVSLGYEEEDTDNGTIEFSNTGIYALYQFSLIEDLTVSMGVRQDDNNEYGTETLGRVSASWSLTDYVDVRASWGEGFKAPTIFQTTFFCCGATGPNTGLQAEESDAFDVGVDWRFPNGDGSLSVTLFDQDTTNLIDFSFGVGGYENISEVESRGVELAFSYRLTETLSATTNLAYINSEDGDGQELARLPELTADLALIWRPIAGLNSTLAIVYNDEEEDSRGTVDSWTRLDLSANYAVNDNVEVFGRLENLGDKDYQQIFGYGTPERSGYVGVTYTF